MEPEKEKRNYRTTKEQAQLLDEILKKCEELVNALDINNSELQNKIKECHSKDVSECLPGVFKILTSKLDLSLQRGIGITSGLQTQILEHVEKVQKHKGAQAAYTLKVQLTEWVDQTRRVILEQVEELGLKLQDEGVIALHPLKWDGSLGPEEDVAIQRLGFLLDAYQVATWYWEVVRPLLCSWKCMQIRMRMCMCVCVCVCVCGCVCGWGVGRRMNVCDLRRDI